MDIYETNVLKHFKSLTFYLDNGVGINGRVGLGKGINEWYTM